MSWQWQVGHAKLAPANCHRPTSNPRVVAHYQAVACLNPGRGRNNLTTVARKLGRTQQLSCLTMGILGTVAVVSQGIPVLVYYISVLWYHPVTPLFHPKMLRGAPEGASSYPEASTNSITLPGMLSNFLRSSSFSCCKEITSCSNSWQRGQ